MPIVRLLALSSRAMRTWLGLPLLLLSRFSRVWLCATPETAAHPSLWFSRQEPWSGLPFPSLMHESEKWKVKVKSLSRVRLLATPWTAAYQAPLCMGFSRQEYWSTSSQSQRGWTELNPKSSQRSNEVHELDESSLKKWGTTSWVCGWVDRTESLKQSAVGVGVGVGDG